MKQSQKVAYSLLFLLSSSSLFAAERVEFRPRPYDWPQWQGADRTALSKETGLLKTWPKSGPRLTWKAKQLGGGYSTPSVAAGRVFGMGYRGNDEIVWALDEATGEELWSKRIAAANRRINYNEGSRCTPTVDGDWLYALGTSGDLVCLEAASGKERWHKNLVKDFGGGIPGWGYCESPLIDGNTVVATPGGQSATLVALDKNTGKTIWKAQVPGGDPAHYSSAIAADAFGTRQYIQFLRGGVVSVAADSGKFLWRYNNPANGTANCSTPIYHNEKVFAASGYGTGGGLVSLKHDNDAFTAEQIYFTKQMKNQHGGMVLIDGYIYGSDEGLLTCLEFATGKLMWEDRKPGKGSIAYADGQLYYRNEGGPIVLVDATPKNYAERGRFVQPEKSGKATWPHPVIANGRLYIRDQDMMFCYDVKQ